MVPIKKFDSTGNVVYFENEYSISEYNSFDKITRFVVLGTGVETLYDYDSAGNMIHTKSSNGAETWSDYDSVGNLIRYRESDGYFAQYEYDLEGNLTRMWDSTGLDNHFEHTPILTDDDSDEPQEMYDVEIYRAGNNENDGGLTVWAVMKGTSVDDVTAKAYREYGTHLVTVKQVIPYY